MKEYKKAELMAEKLGLPKAENLVSKTVDMKVKTRVCGLEKLWFVMLV